MRLTSLRFTLLLFLGVIPSSLPAEDEKPEKNNSDDVVLPEKFEKGSLHLSGASGERRKRDTFKVSLLPDGTLHIERKYNGKLVADEKAQLTKKQTKDFYDAMVKIVSETDEKKLFGKSDRGWSVTAMIKLDDDGVDLRSQKYTGIGSFEKVSPEFRRVIDLINQQLPDDPRE